MKDLTPFQTIKEKHQLACQTLEETKNNLKALVGLGVIESDDVRRLMNKKCPSFLPYLLQHIEDKWGHDEHGNHPGYICDYEQYHTNDITLHLPLSIYHDHLSAMDVAEKLHKLAQGEDNFIEFIKKGIELAKSYQ